MVVVSSERKLSNNADQIWQCFSFLTVILSFHFVCTVAKLATVVAEILGYKMVYTDRVTRVCTFKLCVFCQGWVRIQPDAIPNKVTNPLCWSSPCWGVLTSLTFHFKYYLTITILQVTYLLPAVLWLYNDPKTVGVIDRLPTTIEPHFPTKDLPYSQEMRWFSHGKGLVYTLVSMHL